MGAMVLSLLLSWLILRRIAVMPLVTGVVVLIFGGLTLWLQDDTFIKMKPTIVNSLFGVDAARRAALRPVAAEIRVRRRLQAASPRAGSSSPCAGACSSSFLAVANEVVWRMFDTDTWVAFKVWGIMPHHHRVLDAAAAGADEVRAGPTRRTSPPLTTPDPLP